MIKCHRKYLEERCLERGFSISEVMPCVVSMDGDMWTVDIKHASYPRAVGALSFKCVEDCSTPQFACLPGYCCTEISDGTNSCLPCSSSSSSSSSSYKSCWDQRYTQNYNYGCDAGTHCCNGVCVEDFIDGVYNPCKCWECDGYYSSNCFDFDHPSEEGFCYDIGRAMSKEECEAGNPAEGIYPCSCSGPNCV